MKKNISVFTKEERQNITELFRNGHHPKEIATTLNIPYYEVLFILNRLVYNFELDKYVSYANLCDEQILIISDTHIGSQYENLEYIEEAYRFAKEHGISTVIHGGDLIQSTFTNVKQEYQNEERQIEHLICDYPYYEDIKSYILLGNHDFNTFVKNELFEQMLTCRDDFEIMGCKRAYLTWLKNLICILHPAKRYQITIPNIDPLLYLKGHSHKLTYDKNNGLHIPTLSDDLFSNPTSKPGFLTGTIKDDELSIDAYIFKESLHHKGPILTKKLK